MYEFFENHPEIEVFCNVNLGDLEKILQRI